MSDGNVASTAADIPSEWRSGDLVYQRVLRDGKPFATLKGASEDDTDNAYAVRVDPTTKKLFFSRVSTKEKLWELPAVAHRGASGANTVEHYRARLVAMYETYAPEKINQVDRLLIQYESNEEACIAALVKKYGPEPATASSGSASKKGTTLSSPRSYEERVRRFYEVYCPSKLAAAPKQLEKYHGQEEALIEALISKYGPEPPASGGVESTGDAVPPSAAPAPSSLPAAPSTTGAVSSKPSDGVAPSDSTPSGTYSATSTAAPASDRKSTATPNREALLGGTEPSSSGAFSSSSPRDRLSSVYATEAENRERLLTQFIQDREQRLAEVHLRYETAAAALENLRRVNHELTEEMEALRKDTESQLTQSRLTIVSLKEEVQVARNEWHREKQQLEAAILDATANSNRTVQQERLRLEEETVRFLSEKARLQRELHEAKQELSGQLQRSTDLIAVLDKQEREHQRLVSVIGELTQKIEGVPRVSRQTQTEAAAPSEADVLLLSGGLLGQTPFHNQLHRGGDGGASHAATTAEAQYTSPQLPSGGGRGGSVGAGQQYLSGSPAASGRQVEAALAAMEAFDRALSTEKYRRNELEAWKSRCTELERELDAVREGKSGLSALSGQGYCATPCDCAGKLKQLRATIGSLRSGNRALEQKIADLELRLVAQPPPTRSTTVESSPAVGGSESNRSTDRTDDETLQLREAVIAMREQLSDARAQSKGLKKEVLDLRARLMCHMSTPSNQIAARR